MGGHAATPINKVVSVYNYSSENGTVSFAAWVIRELNELVSAVCQLDY